MITVLVRVLYWYYGTRFMHVRVGLWFVQLLSRQLGEQLAELQRIALCARELLPALVAVRAGGGR